jgi:nanoRNase/pAp phosphatase (c-di-AMP/oligoRNAs hydrolase)
MTATKWDLSRSEKKLDELADALSRVGQHQILVLAHNNPDPDAIASAYGFSFLLHKRMGTRSVLGYGGVVARAENKAMIQRLRIPIVQMPRVVQSSYYAAVLLDAQPGTGNNLLDSKGEPPLAVIDHHPLRPASLKSRFHDIRPDYGATSTIVTEYILAAGLTPDRSVANALFYAIKTDTNSLLRGATPFDVHAYNYLLPRTNPRVLGWIERPRLSMEYFRDHCCGLARAMVYRDVAVSYLGEIESEAIIPELADLLLRIDGVRWSLCMGKKDHMMILSMRSTSRTFDAGKVIRRLAGRRGSAGGHREMAGGQVPLNGVSEPETEKLASELIDKFLRLIDRQGVHPKPLVRRQ